MNIHDIYAVMFRYFRTKRMALIRQLCCLDDRHKVVDIGGNSIFWRILEEMGATVPEVTVVNLYPRGEDDQVVANWVVGSGLALPFKDKSFDIAFSNSVIEHLGAVDRQREFAAEVTRVAKMWFVQTPDRHFPVEPHYITPCIHWLPVNMRRKAARFTLWGIMERPCDQEVQRRIEEIRLLDYKEMKHLFPESLILRERLLGMSKSLIAVGGHGITMKG
jgi:hypothetical protein